VPAGMQRVDRLRQGAVPRPAVLPQAGLCEAQSVALAGFPGYGPASSSWTAYGSSVRTFDAWGAGSTSTRASARIAEESSANEKGAQNRLTCFVQYHTFYVELLGNTVAVIKSIHGDCRSREANRSCSIGWHMNVET